MGFYVEMDESDDVQAQFLEMIIKIIYFASIQLGVAVW